MIINCIIIDDEPIAREGMANYISSIKELNLVASCKCTLDAIHLIETGSLIDLIFLDIEMPNMSGIEFLKNQKPQQLIVLTTAYTKYAIEGFDLNVLDYLLKPISLQRFNQCVEKIKDYLNYKSANIISDKKYLFVKNGQMLQKIFLSEILYIEASSNYCKIFTSNNYYLQYGSLYKLQEKLEPSIFKKVHRSYIVNINHITSYNSKSIYIKDINIPVSSVFDVTDIAK